MGNTLNYSNTVALPMKLKELRKPKNILKYSAEELSIFRLALEQYDEKITFTKAVESTGIFQAIYNFHVVIGKVIGEKKVWYELAKLYADKELYEGIDTKEIKALVYTGAMSEYTPKNTYYRFKAADGKRYKRASFLRFETIKPKEEQENARHK